MHLGDIYFQKFVNFTENWSIIEKKHLFFSRRGKNYEIFEEEFMHFLRKGLIDSILGINVTQGILLNPSKGYYNYFSFSLFVGPIDGKRYFFYHIFAIFSKKSPSSNGLSPIKGENLKISKIPLRGSREYPKEHLYPKLSQWDLFPRNA